MDASMFMYDFGYVYDVTDIFYVGCVKDVGFILYDMFMMLVLTCMMQVSMECGNIYDARWMWHWLWCYLCMWIYMDMWCNGYLNVYDVMDIWDG